MAAPHLYLGNKNYSSWSMRPWLALRWAGVNFGETVLPLGAVGGPAIGAIAAVSPSGKVPALKLDAGVIWDSLAICEWAAEQAPDAGLWPAEPFARAVARAAACEMHSGFVALRRELPMNIRRRAGLKRISDAAEADIARVQALWTDLRDRFGVAGPWLFGQRTIADAMYAPVATRFRTYEIALQPVCAAYCETLFADADLTAWCAAAAIEAMSIPSTDEI